MSQTKTELKGTNISGLFLHIQLTIITFIHTTFKVSDVSLQEVNLRKFPHSSCLSSGPGSQLWAVWWLVEFRQQKQPLHCFSGAKVQGCNSQKKKRDREREGTPIHQCGDAVRGDSGGWATPDWEALRQKGGGQLEANVLHHDQSIVVWHYHVLLWARGLDLTLAISLSLHITLNNHHPFGKGPNVSSLSQTC